jgi:hypothetical protein
MSENKNNGGPAFPCDDVMDQAGKVHRSGGMSLRDYFAGKVLAALMTQTSADRDFPNPKYRCGGDLGETVAQRAAKISYAMADAMLEARK